MDPRPSVFSPDGLEWSDGGRARVDNDGGLRKSSRASVKQILSESERSREERRSKAPPKRTAPAEPARPLTQAEILAEAAVTEARPLSDTGSHALPFAWWTPILNDYLSRRACLSAHHPSLSIPTHHDAFRLRF